ncbi:E3 SUMO-protein ligase ZBED1 [Pygocentrus nattereri]|uniref:E3 SUMO-protein ligase ZBED1 n=1 Tax=Pygocentrus nattereri TaxID=42514 RepID=UPI000814B111|nr:E3 SUMO-protein ligase ZBED1 [Pygocentrus nattereri]XP_017557224.1 E3 SUMO-protein ligase ZBED1 [Pygocentrus nattereri]XP_017557232.1 E3 SUMO-protein ligase ZBED1 [Pygocentrus nattereri]
MEKWKAPCERNRFKKEKGGHSPRRLSFKTIYRHRSSTQTGREHSTQETHRPGLQRREHDSQLHKPYVRQLRLPTCIGDQRRSNLRTHMLNMIVMDLQPLNLVEEEGFQQLVQVLQPSADIPLSASWVRTELLSMYAHIRLKVQKEVSYAKDLVLSAEMWISSKDASYLTVICHFIDENWELKSYMLETAHLLGEHTPENVHQQLVRISTEWKIIDKIQVVVVNVDGMKKQKARWTYMPCFSHTLNKVFNEAMDNSDWRGLLKKCRRIVAFFHQKSEALRTVQLTQSPGADWLPVLTMLENISDQWQSISTEFMKRQEDNLWLNEKERMMLDSAVVALRVIKNIVEEMGESGYSSVSNIIPMCDKLQRSLEHLRQNGNKVAQRLAERIDHHMGSIKQNLLFSVSTALDPRFKSSVLQHFEKIKAYIKEEMRKQGSGASSSGCKKEHGGQRSYEDLLLHRYATESDTSRTLNPFVFWSTKNDFKELTIVAHKYLTLVSTAIPLERVMQQEKSQLVFNRRKCVELENINMMLFLNNNHKI